MTDFEGSTRLWAAEPEAIKARMRRHHELLHAAIAQHGGWRPKDHGEGDAVFAAFRSATAAVDAVAEIQRVLAGQAWPTSCPLRVRAEVHQVRQLFLQVGHRHSGEHARRLRHKRSIEVR